MDRDTVVVSVAILFRVVGCRTDAGMRQGLAIYVNPLKYLNLQRLARRLGQEWVDFQCASVDVIQDQVRLFFIRALSFRIVVL